MVIAHFKHESAYIHDPCGDVSYKRKNDDCLSFFYMLIHEFIL